MGRRVPALAAKHATDALPVVFIAVGDPVTSGLVSSLARPGGNITGLSLLFPELVGKCLELLKQAARVGFSMRTKVHIAWLGTTLRLEAREHWLELRPTSQDIVAVYLKGGEEVRIIADDRPAWDR